MQSPANEDDELILVVAPLSANEEIAQLFTTGLIDYETAIPAALHSLGCSAEEIASAMQRRRDAESKEANMNDVRESTERAELKARTKLANNPPPAGATGGAKPSAAVPKTTTTKPPGSAK